MTVKKTSDGLWSAIAVQVAALFVWMLLTSVVWIVKAGEKISSDYIIKVRSITFFTAVLVIFLLSIFFSNYIKSKRLRSRQIAVICIAIFLGTVLWIVTNHMLNVLLGISNNGFSTSFRFYFISTAFNLVTIVVLAGLFFSCVICGS